MSSQFPYNGEGHQQVIPHNPQRTRPIYNDFATAAINTPEKAQYLVDALHQHDVTAELQKYFPTISIIRLKPQGDSKGTYLVVPGEQERRASPSSSFTSIANNKGGVVDKGSDSIAEKCSFSSPHARKESRLEDVCEMIEARSGNVMVTNNFGVIESMMVEDENEEKEDPAPPPKRKNKKKKKSKKKKVVVVDDDGIIGDKEGDLLDDVDQKEEVEENEPTSSSASSGSGGDDHEIILRESILQPHEASVTDSTDSPKPDFQEESTVLEDTAVQPYSVDNDSKESGSEESTENTLESIPMTQQDSNDTCQSRSEHLKTPPDGEQDLPDIPSIVVQSPSNVSKCSERTYVSSREGSLSDIAGAEIDVVLETKETVEVIYKSDIIIPEIAVDHQNNLAPVESPKMEVHERPSLIFGSLSPGPVSWNVRPPPDVRSRQQLHKGIQVRLPHARVTSLPHPLTLPTSAHPQPPSLLFRKHPAPINYHAHTSPSTPQGHVFSVLPPNPTQEICHPLTSTWTLYFSNTSKALRKQPSLPVLHHLTTTSELFPKAAATNLYSHGLVPLFAASNLEDLLGGYKALRRGIASRKGRIVEPIGTKIAKGDTGLGMPLMEDDSNFHFFRDGVKPMWEDEMCAMGGKIMMTGTPKEMDQLFFDLILLLISGDLDDLPPKSSHLHRLALTPAAINNNDREYRPQVLGLVLSKRKVATRIEIWLSGGRKLPPPAEFVEQVHGRLVGEYQGFRFYAYKSFLGKMDEPENDIEGRLLGLVEERGRRDAAEGTRGEMKREDTARKVSLVSRGRVREEEVKEEGDE